MGKIWDVLETRFNWFFLMIYYLFPSIAYVYYAGNIKASQ